MFCTPLCTLHEVRESITCCCIMVRLSDAAECVGFKFYCLHIYLALGMMMLLCGLHEHFIGSKTCASELSGVRHLRNSFPRVACSLSQSMSCNFVFICDNRIRLVESV
jgi:hypothetical protein